MAYIDTKNDQLLAYVKQRDDRTVVIVVNLDPDHAQEGAVSIPSGLGLPDRFAVQDLLGGDQYEWGVGDNYVRLEPGAQPAHILAVQR